jgi:very-short-patch-repair endonuclease
VEGADRQDREAKPVRMPLVSSLILHPAPPAVLGPDARISWLAGRQHGLITRPQLIELGLSRHQVGGRVSRGLLIPVHRTVYALGTRPRTHGARALAAVLACGEGAVASHATAAALQGMLPERRGPVDVTTPPPARELRGIALHTSRSCLAAATTLNGIPCTGPPRTLVDTASTDGVVATTRAWTTLAGRRALRPRAIEQELRCHPRRRGSEVVRALLEAHRLAVTGRTRSQLEAEALRMCAAHGLPVPAVNQLVRLDDATYEADLLWADARLIVELDGWDAHNHPDAAREDHRRDFDLDIAGWSVVRLMWADITAQAALTAERLRRRIAQGR